MSRRILIVDALGVQAQNLRARLEALGAEASIVADPEALDGAHLEDCAAVVTDWSLGALAGEALLSRLSPQLRPVYLFTDDPGASQRPERWRSLGVRRAFPRLSRGDLVAELELLLAQGAPAPASTLPPSFLLVEDSPTIRLYVSKVLKQAFAGCEILEAEDGKAALAVMKASRVSLILTDLQMPGMDGQSFVQLLRNNAVLRKKPVLVFSGMITAKLREDLAGQDKVALLAKPASPEDLAGAVKGLLG